MKKSWLLFFWILAFIFIYRDTFFWLNERFLEENSFYFHGYLVPFVSFFMLKRKLPSVKVVPHISSGELILAWCIIIFSFSLHFSGYFWDINFLKGVSLVCFILGSALLFLGQVQFRRALGPILFLFFMIPLPQILITSFSFYLKLLATSFAEVILRLMGLKVIREGNVIFFLKERFVVGDPCSGLRSIISFLALGVVLSYFSSLTLRARIFLILISLPISLVVNVLRIVSVVFLSKFLPAPVLISGGHLFLGIIFYITGALIYILIARLLL